MFLVAAALATDVTVFTDGALPADGRTDSVVQVFVPNLPDDADLKFEARGAKVVGTQLGEQGTIAVTLRPNEVDAPASVGLVVRSKTGIDATLEVPVVPVPGLPTIEFDPPRLDGDGGVLVRVRPDGPVGKLVIACSAGTVTSLAEQQDGTWTALYSPPPNLERPIAVVFTTTDLVAPEHIVGQAVLQIAGDIVRTLPAPPDTETTLVVGDRTYGPVRANTGGVASFALELWPGEATGELSWQGADSKKHTVTVDLENPAPPQILFAPWPKGTGMPGGETVTLWLVAVDAAGQPRDRAPDLVVTGPGGPVPAPGEDGWHRIEVSVPQEPGPFDVIAKLGVASSTLSLKSVPPIPEVEVKGFPPVLLQANEVRFDAAFTGSRGGRTADDLQLHVLGAPTKGQGVSVTADVTGLRTATVVAGTTFEPTGLPPARVRIWSGVSWFAAGDTAPLFVVVEDALGMPVPGRPVRLTADVSLKDLPEAVDTGPEGWVMVPYGRIDDRAEPLGIRAESGGLAAGTAVWPHPLAFGTAEDVAMRVRWGHGLSTLRVRRDGAPEGSAVEKAPALPEPEPEPQKPGGKPPKPEPLEPPTPIGRQVRKFTWQVGGGYADVGIRTRQEAADSDFVDDARIREPLPFGAVGAYGRGELWHSSGFGIEAGGRIGGYTFQITSADYSDSAGAWIVGARYRRPFLEKYGWQVLLGMQRTDMIAFLWDAEHVTALKRTEPVTGIRAGGALTGQFGIVWLRFEAAETFAFAPTITDVGFRTDVALPWNPGGIGTYFTAGLDMSYRYGNRSFFEGRAQMRELQGIVTIGVAVGSPLKRDVD